MLLSKRQINKIKEILTEAYGQKWASKIAKKCNCSVDFVYKVLNLSKNDTRQIIPTALELAADYQEEKKQFQEKFKKVVS